MNAKSRTLQDVVNVTKRVKCRSKSDRDNDGITE